MRELNQMFGDHLLSDAVQGVGRLFVFFTFTNERILSVSCTWQAAHLRLPLPAYLDLTSHSVPLGTSTSFHALQLLVPPPIHWRREGDSHSYAVYKISLRMWSCMGQTKRREDMRTNCCCEQNWKAAGCSSGVRLGSKGHAKCSAGVNQVPEGTAASPQPQPLWLDRTVVERRQSRCNPRRRFAEP